MCDLTELRTALTAVPVITSLLPLLKLLKSIPNLLPIDHLHVYDLPIPREVHQHCQVTLFWQLGLKGEERQGPTGPQGRPEILTQRMG